MCGGWRSAVKWIVGPHDVRLHEVVDAQLLNISISEACLRDVDHHMFMRSSPLRFFLPRASWLHTVSV